MTERVSKLATIYGGSGALGRQIVRLLAKEGWRVRVACRRPNEALFVKPFGAVGQVEPLLCNIRNEDSVRALMAGADVAVNCVGTFDRSGPNNFGAVQAEGAGRIARIAVEQGVERMVHISALGADANSPSRYQQTKAEGEAAVLAAFPGAVILRPSVVFGPDDKFFNRFAGMAPFITLVGAETKFQPVYVEDVAAAAAMGVLGTAGPGVYELGGPDVASLRGLMHMMLGIINRRRAVIGLPFWAGSLIGGTLDIASAMTGRLFRNSILTRDQVLSLHSDNVVAKGARGFDALGITPTAMEAVLGEYLWRFRPSGQYDAIKASAQNLRGHS